VPQPTADLPKLRRADCGHGYLPVDAKPSGVDHVKGEDVFLCAVCRAALNRPIETKA
jgi:hypothetical protein